MADELKILQGSVPLHDGLLYTTLWNKTKTMLMSSFATKIKYATLRDLVVDLLR